MTEAAIVEAIRGAGTGLQTQMAQEAARVADPDAIVRFQEALSPTPVTDIPFAAQVQGTWQTLQANHQGILHRIKALTELREEHGPSMAEMSLLQYEVANLSFQQEVVTNIAKKSSDAVSTLVKNG